MTRKYLPQYSIEEMQGLLATGYGASNQLKKIQVYFTSSMADLLEDNL